MEGPSADGVGLRRRARKPLARAPLPGRLRGLFGFLFALAALGLCALGAPSSARASTICSSSTVTNVSFGSFDPLPGAKVDTTATFNLYCTGAGGSSTNYCLSLDAGSGGLSGTTRLITTSSGATLRYNLYSDAARTVPWGSRTNPSLGTIPVITASGPTVNVTRTIYARLEAGQSTAAVGSYSSSFSGTSADVYSLASGSDCIAGAKAGGAPDAYPAFDVLATLTSNCNLTVQNLDFGTQGLLTQNVDATSTMSIQCTMASPYTVALGNGGTGTSPTTRMMTNGAASIVYGLYLDSGRSSPWGSTSGALATGTGTGSSQTLTVYGRVAPQSTPAVGSYSDAVLVTVSY